MTETFRSPHVWMILVGRSWRSPVDLSDSELLARIRHDVGAALGIAAEPCIAP